VSGITVVLVASLGGERLRATLDSVGWAARVAVTDPGGGAELSSLPPGTSRWEVSELSAQVGDEWVLLLAEGDRVSDGLRAALPAATRDGGPCAYRVPLEYAAFGGTLRPRGEPVRLCRGGLAGIGLSAHGAVELRTAERAASLDEVVRVAGGATLLDGVYELDRDAAAWAALAVPEGDLGPVHAIRIGTTSLVRMVLGRSRGRLGWGRLVLAVLRGYRAVLTLGKAWEARRGPAT
jgi:hypothetical protein